MRIAYLLIFCSVLAGCAGNPYQAMQSSELQQLQMTSSIDVYYKGSYFWLQTTSSTRDMGLLPKFISDKTGATGIPPSEEYVRKFSIEQPINTIKDEVINSFNTALDTGIGNFNLVEVKFNEDLSEKIQSSEHYSDFYLVLENSQWMSSYYVSDWNTQWFLIGAFASLVKRESNETIWKGYCSVDGRKDDKLTLDTKFMMDDNAQQVKEILSYGAQGCADQLIDQLKGNFPAA